MKNNLIKNGIKYGIILGLCFCLYTTFMWLTKLDTKYLNVGQYLDMAIILLPVIVIFIAIRNQFKISDVNFISRIAIALVIGIVSGLIYSPFIYFYHNYINPEWFNAVLNLEESKLLAIKTDPKIIAEKLLKLKQNNLSQKGMFNLSAIIPSMFILPTIIAVLSLIFIRKKTTN